jgi:hypothetical protein
MKQIRCKRKRGESFFRALRHPKTNSYLLYKGELLFMKQLGNLAHVCAGRRKNVLLQILDGNVSVHVGEGPDKEVLTAKWTDDETVSKIIYELNHGRYSEKAG